MTTDATLLEVLGCGTSFDVDGAAWPTAVVDVSEYPEIADLARVHAMDGLGDISTIATKVTTSVGLELLLLAVRLTAPVQATFVLAFQAKRDDEVLRDAASTGQLALAITDPEAPTDSQPQRLALNIDGSALLAAIQAG